MVVACMIVTVEPVIVLLSRKGDLAGGQLGGLRPAL